MAAVVKGPFGYKGSTNGHWTHDPAYFQLFGDVSLAKAYVKENLPRFGPKYRVVEIDQAGVDQLWVRLNEIPIDDSEHLTEPFLHFKVGTPRVPVQQWLTDTIGVSLTEAASVAENQPGTTERQPVMTGQPDFSTPADSVGLDHLLGDCPDERFRRLIAEVWERIPKLDRHLILTTTKPIIYHPGEPPNTKSALQYAHGPMTGMNTTEYLAGLSELWYEIFYFHKSEVSHNKSDVVLLMEIARVLAYIVLRFAMFDNLLRIVQKSHKSVGWLPYTDLRQCLDIQVDLLLAKVWGFETEWMVVYGSKHD